MSDRYWFDSFPGIDLSFATHPILDFYGTPAGGPDNWYHALYDEIDFAFDQEIDPHAPYTTVSQNRGGVA